MFSSQVPGPLERLHWASVTSTFKAIKSENQKESDKNKMEEMEHMPPHRCERSGLSPHLWKCMTQEGSLKPGKAVIPRSCQICPSSLWRMYVLPKVRPLHPGGTPALGVARKECRSVFKEKGLIYRHLCEQDSVYTSSGLQSFTIENAESFSLQVIHRKCQPGPALFNSGWKLLTLLAEGLGFPQVQ